MSSNDNNNVQAVSLFKVSGSVPKPHSDELAWRMSNAIDSPPSANEDTKEEMSNLFKWSASQKEIPMPPRNSQYRETQQDPRIVEDKTTSMPTLGVSPYLRGHVVPDAPPKSPKSPHRSPIQLARDIVHHHHNFDTSSSSSSDDEKRHKHRGQESKDKKKKKSQQGTVDVTTPSVLITPAPSEEGEKKHEKPGIIKQIFRRLSHDFGSSGVAGHEEVKKDKERKEEKGKTAEVSQPTLVMPVTLAPPDSSAFPSTHVVEVEKEESLVEESADEAREVLHSSSSSSSSEEELRRCTLAHPNSLASPASSTSSTSSNSPISSTSSTSSDDSKLEKLKASLNTESSYPRAPSGVPTTQCRVLVSCSDSASYFKLTDILLQDQSHFQFSQVVPDSSAPRVLVNPRLKDLSSEDARLQHSEDVYPQGVRPTWYKSLQENRQRQPMHPVELQSSTSSTQDTVTVVNTSVSASDTTAVVMEVGESSSSGTKVQARITDEIVPETAIHIAPQHPEVITLAKQDNLGHGRGRRGRHPSPRPRPPHHSPKPYPPHYPPPPPRTPRGNGCKCVCIVQ